MTEYEQRCRRAIAKLGAISMLLRERDRVEQFVESMLRHGDELSASDVEAGVNRLIDTTEGRYVPVPSDLLGMAQMCRDERIARQRDQDRRDWSQGIDAHVGDGCPHCRHEGYTAPSRIREGVWRDGGGIVHCTEHDMGWQGRLAAERDPGPGGYVTAQQMRALMERMSETNARYRVVWARLTQREKRGEEIDWRRYAGASAVDVEVAEREVLGQATTVMREAA